MWVDGLLSSRVTQGVLLSAQFAEAKHSLLAENIANIDTPDYRTRRLDHAKFVDTLSDAFAQSKATDVKTLRLRGNRQVRTDQSGRLSVTPQVEPSSNLLFHDGRNAGPEQLLSEVQENALNYRMSLRFLKGRFDGLMNAIRGRMR